MLDTLNLADKNGYFVEEPRGKYFSERHLVGYIRGKCIGGRVTNEISITFPVSGGARTDGLNLPNFFNCKFPHSSLPLLLYSLNSWNISKTT